MRSLVVAPGRFLVAAVLFTFAGFPLRAQTNNGAIAGSILDSSGGAVVGAQITATGVETHSVYNTVSSSTGAYRLSDLVLGAYNISVTAPGFKVSELTGVVVQINTTASREVFRGQLLDLGVKFGYRSGLPPRIALSAWEAHDAG